MDCKHEYKLGQALSNLLTNGKTTNEKYWNKGEGLYPSTKAVLLEVYKCQKCGKSIPI